MNTSVAALKRLIRQNRILTLLCVISFLAELAYAILNFSALPMYVSFDLGQGSHLGLIISTFLFTEAVSRPFFGAIGDKIGRKPLLMLGPLITIFTAYLTIRFRNPWILLGMRALDGVGCGAFWPTAYALTGDLTDEQNRSAAMSMLNALYLSALALGFLLGGAANNIAGNHEASFYVVSVIMAVCFLTAAFTLPRRIKVKEHLHLRPDGDDIAFAGSGAMDVSAEEMRKINIRTIWRSFKIVPDMLVFACVTFLGIGLLMPVVKLYCIEHLGLSEVGFGMAVLPLAIVMGVCAVPLGKFADKYGKCFSVCYGISACAGAMWLIALFANPTINKSLSAIVTEFSAGVIWLGFIVTFPAWMALLSCSTDPTRRGEVIGAVGMAQGISAIVGAAAGAYIYSNEIFSFDKLGIVNHNFPFWVCAVLLTIAAFIAFTWVVARRAGCDSGTKLIKVTAVQRTFAVLAIFAAAVCFVLWVVYTYMPRPTL